jgi:hypothetical protein
MQSTDLYRCILNLKNLGLLKKVDLQVTESRYLA